MFPLVFIHIHTYILYIIYIYIYTYIHTYIHTCIHTYIDTYIHTYIHTYRQTDRQTDRQIDLSRHSHIHTCAKINDYFNTDYGQMVTSHISSVHTLLSKAAGQGMYVLYNTPMETITPNKAARQGVYVLYNTPIKILTYTKATRRDIRDMRHSQLDINECERTTNKHTGRGLHPMWRPTAGQMLQLHSRVPELE